MNLTNSSINPFSLIYLYAGGKVLLLKRLSQKKLLGGKIVGLGGKVEPGEDIITSAIREFREETGLELLDPVIKGTYTWLDNNFIGISHIVVASKYSGELIESNEGDLDWYDIETLNKLDNLAKYQYNFLPDVFEIGFHYNGIGIFNRDELLSYADTRTYFFTLNKINH